MRLGVLRSLGLAALVCIVGAVVAWRWAQSYLNQQTATHHRWMDLGKASRLIFVEARLFDSSNATITLFEREGRDGAWRKVGNDAAAKIGRAGLAWGHTFRHLAADYEPIKQEGDKRAPAGVFELSRPFGLIPGSLPDYMQLGEQQHFCVDDVGSEKYSQIVPSNAVPEGTSGERMWEIGLYKRGIVIDYPTDRTARSGSCIFVHVWKTPETPTSGCVAASEETVARLQEWVSEASGGAWIAIAPEGARDRLGLRLPE